MVGSALRVPLHAPPCLPLLCPRKPGLRGLDVESSTDVGDAATVLYGGIARLYGVLLLSYAKAGTDSGYAATSFSPGSSTGSESPGQRVRHNKTETRK
eukprot:2367446-Rhodomonas_salina.1